MDQIKEKLKNYIYNSQVEMEKERLHLLMRCTVAESEVSELHERISQLNLFLF